MAILRTIEALLAFLNKSAEEGGYTPEVRLPLDYIGQALKSGRGQECQAMDDYFYVSWTRDGRLLYSTGGVTVELGPELIAWLDAVYLWLKEGPNETVGDYILEAYVEQDPDAMRAIERALIMWAQLLPKLAGRHGVYEDSVSSRGATVQEGRLSEKDLAGTKVGLVEIDLVFDQGGPGVFTWMLNRASSSGVSVNADKHLVISGSDKAHGSFVVDDW